MKLKAKKLYKLIPKDKTTITTDEILGMCLTNIGLPHNKSDIYLLITVLKYVGILTKTRNGEYEIDHSSAGVFDD